MHVMKVDPRALNENPDRSRQTKSTPQADLLLLATIKAVGIVQPPVIFPQTDGGNGYVIDSGHRRVRQAIKAGLEEIEVIVVEGANDNGAMRSMVENLAREPLNPVDQWRAIERLVALGWTEEAIAIALSLTVRRVRQLRLMANVLPAMLDHMAKGDMPNEQQLRTIASASLDEQKEVWKANKPSKSDPKASWWGIANALTKTRMFAKDASFDDELARAYGIEWEEDLFGPADQDGRYTTNVEAYLGAQQEWMTNNLPKRGIVAEVGDYGEVKLPKKAQQVYPRQNDLAVALREVGRIERTLFIIEWILDTDMQRRAQIGLNKGEAHHALKNALRIGRQGEIRDRTAEGQHYRIAGLNLLTAIIIYWNTVHLGHAVAERRNEGLDAPPELLAHISPLGWAHILLTGEYLWPKEKTA